MNFNQQFKEEIFSTTTATFTEKALALFQYQAKENEIYRQYIQSLKIDTAKIKSITEIPFLPIQFFKTHKVVSGTPTIQAVFESSGTTGQVTSKHHVADIPFYFKVCEAIFNLFYGDLKEYTFWALLPSYAERTNSSLIYMVNHFISQSKDPSSGFYLTNKDALISTLKNSSFAENNTKKRMLIGVTFALLDLVETEKMNLSGIQILETEGMKGRRQEMIREEVHQILTEKLNVSVIGSEYGMTELLSQGYALENGEFQTPPWLKIILRSFDDPFEKGGEIQRGGINVIDLANIDSCAFIETMDIGKISSENKYQVLGRYDNAEIRGCNLMAI